MIFEPFDVVVTPFPYADRSQSAVRPGIILTEWNGFSRSSGIALVAMVTSAKHSSWPLDSDIVDLASAGLPLSCKIRMKLNSVDVNLIHRKIGRLGVEDVVRTKQTLIALLPSLTET